MLGFFRGTALLALAALVLHAVPATAQSLSVEPLFIEVAPGQSGAIRVRNNSEVRQTVELSVVERNVAETGEMTRTAAEDGFVLFPPQASIEPNSVQVFRMQPIEPDPARSHSYYVTVRQIPVALPASETQGARLQVVFAFDVAMHVVPRGVRAEPQIISTAPVMTSVPAPGAEGQARAPDRATREAAPRVQVPGAEIVLRNDGTKYLYLQDLAYDIVGTDAQGRRIELAAPGEDAIVEAARVTLVPPGATRRFTLPLRDAPPLARVDIRVRQRPRR